MCGLLHKPWWPVIQKASLMLTPPHCCYSPAATGHTGLLFTWGQGVTCRQNPAIQTEGCIVAVNTVVNFAASDSFIVSTILCKILRRCVLDEQGRIERDKQVKKNIVIWSRGMRIVMYGHITEQIRQRLLSGEAQLQVKTGWEETKGHLYYSFSLGTKRRRGNCDIWFVTTCFV